jgi:hypothetical protein
MRITLLSAFAILFACAASAQQTTPVDVVTSNPGKGAISGVNTALGGSSAGVHGQGYIGVTAEGTVAAGQFTAQVGTGINVSGYGTGVSSSCVAGSCTAVSGSANGQSVPGVGVFGIGSVGIYGRSRPTSQVNLPVYAGVFDGNVQVTQDLSVTGTISSPVIQDLKNLVASLTTRVAALEATPGAHGTGTFLPARVRAEAYNVGGPGIGYVDSTPGNDGGAYRNDDVDIKTSSEGGYAVGWMTAGEWLAYTVNVPQTRVFALTARVGTMFPNRTFRIEVDGSDMTGPVAVPVFADWDQYANVALPSMQLTAGTHLIHVVVGDQDWLDFRWLDFQ